MGFNRFVNWLRPRFVLIPRWIDAPWAVLSIIAVIWTYKGSNNIPFSRGNLLCAIALQSLALRGYLTCWRINLGISSLDPLIVAAAEWWDRRDQRKKDADDGQN